ncbi:hypothetical protein CYLTODRAFT_457601 [Cylindrobasidium torrendii FP15055 ss-10]|uniref:Uncharacterized protein n=1 Tax=Cylindrobasidium torrendii FP15055 ss-10 TaxID=1314674 RepID=A0A0D7B1I8_9AGAR|nr:hypothetical protein CYLTODRAFT_457601 [Cylindrobasidium torrendii FP15055 ss-10]
MASHQALSHLGAVSNVDPLQQGTKRAAPDDTSPEDESHSGAVAPPTKRPRRSSSSATTNNCVPRRQTRAKTRPRSSGNARPPTVALKPPTPLSVYPPPVAPATYTLGSFDLYAMNHPALKGIVDCDAVDYRRVQAVMHALQTKGSAPTVRCVLPNMPNEDSDSGRMVCRALRDDELGPMHEIVVDDLALTPAFGYDDDDLGVYPKHDSDEETEPPVRQAVVGRCFIADVRLGNVNISGGVFKMNVTPVWIGKSLEGCMDTVEVFEAYLDFAVKFKEGRDVGHGQRIRCGLLGVRSDVDMAPWEPEKEFSGFYANLSQAPLPLVAVP